MRADEKLRETFAKNPENPNVISDLTLLEESKTQATQYARTAHLNRGRFPRI